MENIDGCVFTNKEKGIIGLSLFFPNKEVSNMLNISQNTCRYHLKNIYQKTNSGRDEIRKNFCLQLMHLIDTFEKLDGKKYKKTTLKKRESIRDLFSNEIVRYSVLIFNGGQ